MGHIRGMARAVRIDGGIGVKPDFSTYAPMNLLGIDIGGTKTSVCVGNEHGEIFASQRMPTQASDSLETYTTRLVALCHAVAAKRSVSLADIEAVGISAPGPLDVKKGVLIAPPNNVGWRDVPIVRIVEENLRRPVHINNDANACALAEYYFGGHGVENLVYLTCSTGMGGGIIANGRLIQGPTDTGGEVGHHIVDIHGPMCACGLRGCWEAFVGGRTSAENVKEKIRKEKVKTRMLDLAGGKIEHIDHRIFARAAREGDPFAVREWDAYADRFAQGLANLIMILNPELVILGTIAIHEGDFLLKPVKEKLPKYAWKWPIEACRIIPSALGPKIGDLAALAVAVTALRG